MDARVKCKVLVVSDDLAYCVTLRAFSFFFLFHDDTASNTPRWLFVPFGN